MGSSSLIIKNARLIDPANNLDEVSDLYISQGIIVGIGSAPAGFANNEVVDAKGHWLCPAFIDLCANTGQPGFEQKGTIATETLAAVASGFATLVCPPETKPVVDSPAVASLIQEIADQEGHCEVRPLGALTQGLAGDQLSEMHALYEAGCVGFSNGHTAIRNTRTLLRCLEYAATLELPVFFNPEDADLAEGGCVHMGSTSTRLGLAGIPASAETIAVSKILILVEQTGVKAHFNQLSVARSVELIAAAQKQGLPVTAGVSVKQLLLTDETVDGFNSLYHVRPPFRTEADRLALIAGVNQGVISAICSAHAPHEAAAKMAPFAETQPGMSIFDSFIPSCLELVKSGEITESVLMERLVNGPANILGSVASSLTVNAPATFTIINPNEKRRLSSSDYYSAGQNNPDLDRELTGRVNRTYIDGTLRFPLEKNSL